MIVTVAGTGSAADFGDFGPATMAYLRNPSGVAINPITGDILIADTSNARIRMVRALVSFPVLKERAFIDPV